MDYTIDGIPYTFDVTGEAARGDDIQLLQYEDNLIANSHWQQKGFTCVPLVGSQELNTLQNGIRYLLSLILASEQISFDESWRLQHYHQLVTNEKLHERVLRRTAFFPTTLFPGNIAALLEKVGQELGVAVTTRNPHTGLDLFHVRIIRPHATDFNPLHKDAWIDRLKGAVNLYLPLVGSNQHSSLPVLPGSHHWPEADFLRTQEGTVCNGKRFSVPAVLSCKHPLTLIRPNPAPGEGLLFTPYMIHGGAVNTNPDLTRMSLEIRCWRAA